MRETLGEIDGSAAAVVEHYRVPAAERRRAHPDVDDDIEHRAG
jgi:hypothetical protein